jgi:FkbM family methyltransferase
MKMPFSLLPFPASQFNHKIDKNILKAKAYLKIIELAGFSQIIRAIVSKSIVLLRVKSPGCRFPFMLRFFSSDIETFEQIFMSDGYDFLVEKQPSVIVDAGANIGLASIYFANRYPEAKIIAIEPEKSNFDVLKENCAPYVNIIPLQAALWHLNEEIDLVDPGRGNWGFITQNKEIWQNPSETPQGAICHTVRAITVDRLMDEYALDRINILKIDIECAEKEVFSNTASWIEKVDSIVIELHDWITPGCADSFDNGAPGFDQEWLQGENVIRTRRNCLKKQ